MGRQRADFGRFCSPKPAQIETIFRKYNSKATDAQVEKFLSMVPVDGLSSFEIEHFLAKHLGQPRRALECVDELADDAAVIDSRSLLERSMKRASELTVSDFLKQHNAPKECIEKFVEAGIDDLDQLCEMAGDLEEFGVSKKGDQWRLKKAIEQLQKERELS